MSPTKSILLIIVAIGLVALFAIVSCDLERPQQLQTETGELASAQPTEKPAEPRVETPMPREDESHQVEEPQAQPVQRPNGSIKLGINPYTVSKGVTPKMIVSAFEYPNPKYCGKLKCVEIVKEHNNRSLVCGDPVSSIATYPHGSEMLIVVTVKDEGVDLSGAKIRWTIHDPSGQYGKGVRPSFLMGAGVPEDKAQLSTDQIITEFGHGPVYVEIPQTVKGLRESSGEPVCKIEIAKNQSWIKVYSPSIGVTNFLVSLVHPQNLNYPKIDYSVRWGNKIQPLEQCIDLMVNVTENPANPDPHVFNTSIDQVLAWNIVVTDISDYYLNPTDPGILPLRYPIINYDLRFRRDPIQWDPNNWADVYRITINEPLDAMAQHTARLAYETTNRRAVPPAGPVVRTGLLLEPQATAEFTGYTAFRAHQSLFPNRNVWGDAHYYVASQKAVDVSLRYKTCCKKVSPDVWWNISDESITIEFQPGDNQGISGLQVKYLADGQVELTNQGGAPVYEILHETAEGVMGVITPILGAGETIVIAEVNGRKIARGDWIWYFVQSITHTQNAFEPPVVARQKRVRVQ